MVKCRSSILPIVLFLLIIVSSLSVNALKTNTIEYGKSFITDDFVIHNYGYYQCQNDNRISMSSISNDIAMVRFDISKLKAVNIVDAQLYLYYDVDPVRNSLTAYTTSDNTLSESQCTTYSTAYLESKRGTNIFDWGDQSSYQERLYLPIKEKTSGSFVKYINDSLANKGVFTFIFDTTGTGDNLDFFSKEDPNFQPYLVLTYEEGTPNTLNIIQITRSVASPKQNEIIQFNISLTDNLFLKSCIFSWDDGSGFKNETPISISGTSATCSINKLINSPVNTLLKYKWFMQGSSDQWNQSLIYGLTVIETPIILTANQNVTSTLGEQIGVPVTTQPVVQQSTIIEEQLPSQKSTQLVPAQSIFINLPTWLLIIIILTVIYFFRKKKRK